MKKFLIKIIRIYQKVTKSNRRVCRFYPTCSTYAIQALEKYGIIKGTILIIFRILRCNPLFKGGYDPLN